MTSKPHALWPSTYFLPMDTKSHVYVIAQTLNSKAIAQMGLLNIANTLAYPFDFLLAPVVTTLLAHSLFVFWFRHGKEPFGMKVLLNFCRIEIFD